MPESNCKRSCRSACLSLPSMLPSSWVVVAFALACTTYVQDAVGIVTTMRHPLGGCVRCFSPSAGPLWREGPAKQKRKTRRKMGTLASSKPREQLLFKLFKQSSPRDSQFTGEGKSAWRDVVYLFKRAMQNFRPNCILRRPPASLRAQQ